MQRRVGIRIPETAVSRNTEFLVVIDKEFLVSEVEALILPTSQGCYEDKYDKDVKHLAQHLAQLKGTININYHHHHPHHSV